MSQVDHMDNIAFSSGFEVDKVFPSPKPSGSFSVGASAFPGSAGNIATSTVAQPHGVNVLPIMQFSTDNATWYDAGAMKFAAGGSLDANFTATCYSNSTSVVIIAHNWAGSTQTCYYRFLLVSDD